MIFFKIYTTNPPPHPKKTHKNPKLIFKSSFLLFITCAVLLLCYEIVVSESVCARLQVDCLFLSLVFEYPDIVTEPKTQLCNIY